MCYRHTPNRLKSNSVHTDQMLNVYRFKHLIKAILTTLLPSPVSYFFSIDLSVLIPISPLSFFLKAPRPYQALAPLFQQNCSCQDRPWPQGYYIPSQFSVSPYRSPEQHVPGVTLSPGYRLRSASRGPHSAVFLHPARPSSVLEDTVFLFLGLFTLNHPKQRLGLGILFCNDTHFLSELIQFYGFKYYLYGNIFLIYIFGWAISPELQTWINCLCVWLTDLKLSTSKTERLSFS